MMIKSTSLSFVFLFLGTALVFLLSFQFPALLRVWRSQSDPINFDRRFIDYFMIDGLANNSRRDFPAATLGPQTRYQQSGYRIPTDHDNFSSKKTPGAAAFPTIDILSIGSRRFPQLQKAQNATFGSHKSVRYFYAATEDDDSEVGCDQDMDLEKAIQVSLRCRQRDYSKYPVLDKLAKRFVMASKLRTKPNASGWICAQKRPIDGLINMIRKYNYHDHSTTSANGNINHQNETTIATTNNLPDYLLIVDDDSFVNMDNLVQFIPRAYPVTQSHVVAGCLLVMDDILQFVMPHGGLGILFNRLALERFLQPLCCNRNNETIIHGNNSSPPSWPRSWSQHESSKEYFERLACWRLQQDGIGERSLFRDGMNIVTLMHTYATKEPYNRVRRWKGVGNCLHSDTAWAYYTNYYHLAAVEPLIPQPDPPHGGVNNVLSNNGSNEQKILFSPTTSGGLVGYNQSQLHTWSNHGANNNENTNNEGLEALGQCRYGNDLPIKLIAKPLECDIHAHFCHKMTALEMQTLHRQNLKRFPHHY